MTVTYRSYRRGTHRLTDAEMREAIAPIARKYGLPIETLAVDMAELYLARHEAMVVLREHLGASYSRISEFMGLEGSNSVGHHMRRAKLTKGSKT